MRVRRELSTARATSQSIDRFAAELGALARVLESVHSVHFASTKLALVQLANELLQDE